MERPLPKIRTNPLLAAVALAHAGGVVAYMPLVTLLLPLQVEALDKSAKIDLLTAAVLIGGVAASVANILFGWLSDRSVEAGGGRRRWVVIGLCALALSYPALALALTPAQLLIAVALAQAAINAVLAPLFALIAEEVPSSQKGLAGGLLSLGNPVAAPFAVMLLAVPALSDMARFALVPVAAVGLLLPLLALRARRFDPMPEPVQSWDRRDLLIASGSRLLVQLACATLGLYLLYYFQTLVTDDLDVAAGVGTLLMVSYIIPLPVAVIAGRWSDRSGVRRPFLFVSAAVGAMGLLGMAAAADAWLGAIAFCVFAAGTAVFLSLHATFAMQLLPKPDRRGRDLGLVNLANTLPSMIGTLIVWQLATPEDFTLVMLAFAVLTLAGAVMILAVRERPASPAD
jgi:MFS family permease